MAGVWLNSVLGIQTTTILAEGRRIRRTLPFRHGRRGFVSARSEQILLVVGGGAAGIYASIRAKEVAPHLKVLVIEKGKPLSKVRISGGGRCNVTNGNFLERIGLAENYPRGNKELKGSYFSIHGPSETIAWFSSHGVGMKVEEDGRAFPVSNNSASIIDCLLTEAKKQGIELQTGKFISNASVSSNGKFNLRMEKRTSGLNEEIVADYLLLSTGSSREGYNLAIQLGHSIIDPNPSIFTFKVDDSKLHSLSGITFPKVKAILKIDSVSKNHRELTQVGPLLVTHWGLSGPVILRLSAWGARDLFRSAYIGRLYVDFMPDKNVEEVKSILLHYRDSMGKKKLDSVYPPELGLVKRFWGYLVDREGLEGSQLWATISNKSLNSLALVLKECVFNVDGKGQFKEEFVTAGGVPLSEITLGSMESRLHKKLFFAGEVLNVDGITGGFNFQNAWTGGYIAGTAIGELASSYWQCEAVV